MMKSIDEQIYEHQPTAQHGYAPQKKAGHLALLPPFFSVMLFVSQHTCSTLFFSIENIVDEKPIEKNKELQPTHKTKRHAIKNGVSYLNIKWPYRFASHFFCSAYASMPTHKKNPISTLC